MFVIYYISYTKLNSMARRINLNYFRLEAAVVGEAQYRLANRDLRNFIRVLDQRAWEPIRIPDGWIVFNSLLKENGYFVGSISRIQTQNIPGKRAPREANSKPIDFDSIDEGLDHPTCFIIDTATNIVVLESLQMGVTINQLCGFFSHHLDMDIGATVLLALNVEDFMRNLRQVKRLSFRVSGIENLSDRQKRRFPSLTGMFDMADRTASKQIDLVLGPEPHQNDLINLEAARSLIADLLGIAEVANVDHARVYGSANFEEGESFSEIDLIEQRLQDFIRVDSVRAVTETYIRQRQQQMMMRYEPRREELVGIYRVPN